MLDLVVATSAALAVMLAVLSAAVTSMADRGASQVFAAEWDFRAVADFRTVLIQASRTVPSCTTDFITATTCTGIFLPTVSVTIATDTVAGGAGVTGLPGGAQLITIRGGGGIGTISSSTMTTIASTKLRTR